MKGFWDRDYVVPPMIWGCRDEWKLQFGGSQQVRWETRENFGLKTHNTDHLQFLRTFVNAEVVYDSLIRAYVEVVNADVHNYALNQYQQDNWDVFQAWVELKDAKDSPWALRLGRQVLPIHPEGRLYGRPPIDYYWFNLLPTFDGAMLFYKTKTVDWQTFFLQPTTNRYINDDGVLDTRRLREIDSKWFWGTIATFTDCAPHTYEFYFFGHDDHGRQRTWLPPPTDELKNIGESHRYTVGSRVRGPIKKWEGCGTLGYGLEGAYQFGKNVDDRIDAFMLHADVNYEWEHPWKPKVTLLGNWASGDDRLGDGELNTFDPLYGSSHYGYGTIDFFRLANMREIALTGEIRPTSKLRFLAEAHKFWLDSNTDAWITALGNPGSFGRDPSGKGGNEAGTEFDFTAYYQPNKRLAFETGVAHFTGGDYASAHGMKKDATFLFFQTIFKF